MSCPMSPYPEREKLISGLLIAFKQLLPKLTLDYEIRKVKADIRYHEKMLKEARDVVAREGK